MSASPGANPASEAEWRAAVRRLRAGDATLVSLWGDEGRMRMALREPTGELSLVEVACEDGSFPSVASVHAPAGRLERSACDLFGFTAQRGAGHATVARSRPLAAASSARESRRRTMAGLTLTHSSKPRAPGCTRFPSGPFMQGSSNRVTSASTRAARRSCGWKSGWVTSTRGSTRSCAARASIAPPSLPGGSAAIRRSPTRSPSLARSKRRSGSNLPRARIGSAG